jgi:hypothetical protein
MVSFSQLAVFDHFVYMLPYWFANILGQFSGTGNTGTGVRNTGTGVRHQKTTYAVHSDFQSFPTCRFKRRSTSLIRSFSPGFAITRRPSTRSCALIAVVFEDCAPFITASRDVIDRPCVFQSQTPCHVRTLLYHAAHYNAFIILLMPDPYSVQRCTH